jgi:hypothetical protein
VKTPVTEPPPNTDKDDAEDKQQSEKEKTKQSDDGSNVSHSDDEIQEQNDDTVSVSEEGYTQEQLDLFLREIMSSPILFAIAVLGLIPYEYQRKFIEDLSKRIVLCSVRQVGKSFISAIKALFFALTNPSTQTLIVSRTRRQSMHLFDMILNFIEYFPAMKNCVVRKTRTMIKFSNRSVIHALPCGPNGDTIRSKTAHLLIVDEANYVPETVITEVALPMLATTNGTLILISSPTNKNHLFLSGAQFSFLVQISFQNRRQSRSHKGISCSG